MRQICRGSSGSSSSLLVSNMVGGVMTLLVDEDFDEENRVDAFGAVDE